MMILGTANFGASYGFEENSVSSQSTINEILNIATKKNPCTIDTSESYGDSIRLLKNSGNSFKCIFKIPSDNLNNETNLNSFIRNNNFLKIETLMLHDVMNVDQLDNTKIFEKLLNYAEKKNIPNIGISVYSPKSAYDILKKYHFNVIQLPINVFDQRILSKKYFNFFQNTDVELHFRSIFLQGLLLKEVEFFNKNFTYWKKYFQKWDQWCLDRDISKDYACTIFAKLIDLNKKIIIGVSNDKEIINFQNNLDSTCDILLEEFNELAVNDIDLIDPTKWRT